MNTDWLFAMSMWLSWLVGDNAGMNKCFYALAEIPMKSLNEYSYSAHSWLSFNAIDPKLRIVMF